MCIPKKVGGMGVAGAVGEETSGDAGMDDTASEVQPIEAEKANSSRRNRSAEGFVI
jgi:hypothetical protein